jgi:hypothetical protein
LSKHLGGQAETRVTQISYWWGKVGVIQDVEHFRAELQFERLANREVAVDREVPLRGIETSQGISTKVSLPKWISRIGINGGRAEGADLV